jgi:hypothetical protein
MDSVALVNDRFGDIRTLPALARDRRLSAATASATTTKMIRSWLLRKSPPGTM